MKHLFNYFESHWLRDVRHKNFSVYRATHRTNNAIESYHKQWRDHVQKHPYPSTVIGKIQIFKLHFHNIHLYIFCKDLRKASCYLECAHL